MLRDADRRRPLTLDELVETGPSTAPGPTPSAATGWSRPTASMRDEFDGWWKPNASVGRKSQARARVKRRLLFDATLEFGLQSSFGRTLERTGSVAVQVEAGSPGGSFRSPGQPLDLEGVQDTARCPPLAATPDADLVAWVRGVARAHAAEGRGSTTSGCAKYIDEDGRRFLIWGGRPRTQGMPAFPSGRAAPAFPRVGGATMRGAPARLRHLAAELVRALDREDAAGQPAARGRARQGSSSRGSPRQDVLTASVTESGATVYALAPELHRHRPDHRRRAGDGRDTCSSATSAAHTSPAPSTVVAQLDGAPLHQRRAARVASCARAGARTSTAPLRLAGHPADRRARALRACSRTTCGSSTRRLPGSGGTDPGAPNVLVATPTLEMGIDIGDLSTVLLASLPRTVASYLQRVGRAGPPHRQRAQRRLRHRPRRATAPARRPAVRHQRRGPAAGDLSQRRGDPSTAVHRLGHRPDGPQPVAVHPQQGRARNGVCGDRHVPRGPCHRGGRPCRRVPRGVPRDLRQPEVRHPGNAPGVGQAPGGRHEDRPGIERSGQSRVCRLTAVGAARPRPRASTSGDPRQAPRPQGRRGKPSCL